MNQLIITNNAIKKIVELTNNNEKMLRISVTGGGCQGFQYNLDMDDKKKENDIVIQEKGAIVIIDKNTIVLLSRYRIVNSCVGLIRSVGIIIVFFC